MSELVVSLAVDPSWEHDDQLKMGATSYDRGASKEYNLLNVQGIVEAWGFTVKAEIVWVKRTVNDKLWFGMGHQTRGSHETCLIATRGSPERLSASVRSIFLEEDLNFDAKYSGHSVKPERFFEIVEELSPGPYLELFSRRQRAGWTCLGNEISHPLEN